MPVRIAFVDRIITRVGITIGPDALDRRVPRIGLDEPGIGRPAEGHGYHAANQQQTENAGQKPAGKVFHEHAPARDKVSKLLRLAVLRPPTHGFRLGESLRVLPVPLIGFHLQIDRALVRGILGSVKR